MVREVNDLFTFLEFGPSTAQVTTQLKRIYQKACDDDLELKELFNKLKDLPDRNRKLKAFSSKTAKNYLTSIENMNQKSQT